ncbi:hypothetical protein SPI_02538 [Niveomyces insectorum RCEF 264]|uniref:Uncharacterized protein n=1 Tax=Niveomyces insectorum RCEF 264 TaxID=1081102 RepID=A0A167Y2I8_9HYPO|nr:hypothetical protein SPI_02538 [Niveomyces insectorum RCEF 264]
MLKVKAFTPAWLSAESPDGRGVFSASASSAKPPTFSVPNVGPNPPLYASLKKQASPPRGPRRTIARRGTEIFVANGKEIRWTDLVTMKNAWEATHDSHSSSVGQAFQTKSVYRTLKPPVASDIRQLVISPQSNYMAILTTHTIHICVLPDSSHLVAAEDPIVPLKARYFTIGPTTHVTTRQPLVSALWHPLGVNGSALVTITSDAVVRLWEISPVDRWSFDAPSLSIDVKKLADGTWLDEDFGASVNTNTSYSPDLFDMEVAAACFGPRSSGGWHSMTLYLAMLGGDVYALCPLLPKRFATPLALIPSLSVAIISNLAAVEDDPDATPRAKQLARQQLDWMSQLDNQEPTLAADLGNDEVPTEIYVRPSHPGIVPRLQGPLEVDLDDGLTYVDDDDKTLSDIFVIGEKVDMALLRNGVDDNDDDDFGDEERAFQDLIDDADKEGLSLPVICLITVGGKLHICLDLVGVEAQWLPQRTRHAHKRNSSSLALNCRVPTAEAPLDADQSLARPLLTFQIVDVVSDAETRSNGWCTFSPDVTSRYSFFVTHPAGITHISLSAWVFRLEQELHDDTEVGADFRVRQLVTGENTLRQRVHYHMRNDVLATCVVLRDPDLGCFLLSATEYAPIAISFDAPEGEEPGLRSSTTVLDPSLPSSTTAAMGRSIAEAAKDEAVLALDVWKARPAFEMPPELTAPLSLAQAQNMLFSSRYQMLQHQEVRLSPATLAIFTNAHKLVGKESGRLNQAAAQMFTQLEELPNYLREQVESAASLKRRIDMIGGTDDGAVAAAAADGDDQIEGPVTDDIRLRQRLRQAQTRHADLNARMERLRRTVHRASTRPLSDKERRWVQEVQALAAQLDKADEAAVEATAKSQTAAAASLSAKAASSANTTRDIGLRVKQIKALWANLAEQAEGLGQLSSQRQRLQSDRQGSPAPASEDEDIKSSTLSLVTVPDRSRRSSDTRSPSPSSITAGGAPRLGRRVPADVRKAKMAQVTEQLEREEAMMEAMTERLTRLGVVS